MSLNLPHNLLFKINSIEDNSGYSKKKSISLRKPVFAEEEHESNNNIFKEKKTENNIENNNKNNVFNPFIFNKNSIINSGEDISFKMTFDTLSNVNMTFKNPNINNIINLGQNTIKPNESPKSNSKLKKKRKFNKFKVSYVENRAKSNYKLTHKRKYKPDDIRKKIKARFHKSIKNIINENLKNAGSKYFFSFLPQIFISSISRQKNYQVLDFTYRQLLETDFVSNIDENKYKNKNVDYSKYKNNLKVLEYLDNHPDICKASGFDIMGNMKYKDLLDQYFNSDEFDKAIRRLKEENEEDEYIEEYKDKAKSYVKFFSSLSNNKINSDKLFDINVKENGNDEDEEDDSKDN